MSYDFEELGRKNYYEWRKNQNRIGPIESYESWKARKVEPNLKASQNSPSKKVKKVKAEKAGDAITGAVYEFVTDIVGATEEMIQEVAEEAVEELKRISPVYKGKNKHTPKGRYRRSWRLSTKMTATGFKAKIYNINYQLTHLLENGTLNHDGTQHSKPIPHISVALKHAEEKLNHMLENL